MLQSDVSLRNTLNGFTSNYDTIVGKLTLFSEPLNKTDESESISLLERPITPIEHEIKVSPTTLDQFLLLLRRRITINKNESVTEENQLCLLGIIEKEICIVWPQLISLLDYPFFDEIQNKEMKRSLFITIINDCINCFEMYREKVSYYNKKDIFSSEANLVRVNLQLAEDVKNKLHIPRLRRHMCENISQGILVKGDPCCEVPSIDKLENKFQSEVQDTNRRSSREPQSRLPVQSVKEKESKKKIFQQIEEIAAVITHQTVNEQVLEGEASIDRRQLLKNDLEELMADDDKIPDSLLTIDETLPSIEQYRTKNEQLQKKIKTLIERNDLAEKNETFIPKKSLVEQPSNVPINYKNKIYFAADIRPTPRKNDCDISLALNGALWNELADEITPEYVKLLDSNLFRGEEVKDIYKEMMKTVSHEHLSYTQDDLFEKCPLKINIQDVMSSSTLSNELKKERIINPDLNTLSEAPWVNQNKTRTEWEHPNYKIGGSSSNDMDLKHFVEMSQENISHQKYFTGSSYGGSLASAMNSTRDQKTLSLDNFRDPISSNRDTPIKIIAKKDYVVSTGKFAQGLSNMPRLMQDRLVKQYDEWLSYWKNNFEINDYMKYLSLQSTDFLSVIFHQFDSNDDDTELNDDLYISPEILEQRHRIKEREIERNSIVQQKIQELEKRKIQFISGLWNPASIFIGGLGKTPTISAEEINEILRDKPQLEDPEERLSKMSAYSRSKSAVYNGRPIPLFTKKTNLKTQSSDDNTDINNKISIIQTRLEKIWNNLNMPNHMRLDMTIKYSSGDSLKSIDTFLLHWEEATRLVVERESALSELEKFERIASDPNRFFVKGYRGSSMARLEESKIRTDLHNLLDEITTKTQKAIYDLLNICGDQLTYKGRLYVDKMKWDRTEMLYWLQEERKESCIKTLNTGLSIK